MRTLPALLAVSLVACGPTAPAPADPKVIETTASGLKIRREVFTVKAPAPPANPSNQSATPEALNAVQVVRYRVDGAQPKPARAIVVLMPGFLGGAGSFDALARAIVRRSTDSAPLEAWAVDRRSNLLEDRRGIEAAVAKADANLLSGYYFAGQAVDGERFAGFKAQADVAFMSEWGVATALEDLRAVLALVPAAEQKGRVILAGHSLGAQLVAEYAAWDFAGTPGFAQLAGLVLIDGVTGAEGAAAPGLTQEQYETTGRMGTLAPVPSLAQVRSTSRYTGIPLLESKLFPVGVGTALRAQLRPDAVEVDVERKKALELLFFQSPLPKLTNRAAFGLAFDARSCPVTIAAVGVGEATGGALTDGSAPFGGGTVVKPTDLNATYTWKEYDAVTPIEATSLSDFALAWTRPGVDFGEWYFPSRLSLDAPLGSSLTLKPTDWPFALYGIRAQHGAAMDLPVLALAAGILGGDASKYDALKRLLTATPVGPGRPLAGAARSTRDGFEALSTPGLTHIDPLAGVDAPGTEVGGWYQGLADFALRNTASGGVLVPAQP